MNAERTESVETSPAPGAYLPGRLRPDRMYLLSAGCRESKHNLPRSPRQIDLNGAHARLTYAVVECRSPAVYQGSRPIAARPPLGHRVVARLIPPTQRPTCELDATTAR